MLNYKSDDDLLVLAQGDGTLRELDRQPRAIGASLSLAFVPPDSGEWLVSTAGFEPNDVNDSFQVKIYDLVSGRLIASACSRKGPTLTASADASRFSLTISKDAFAIRAAGAPGWPIVLRISDTVEVADLVAYPEVVADAFARTSERIRDLEMACRTFETEICPLRAQINALSAQLASLGAVQHEVQQMAVP